MKSIRQRNSNRVQPQVKENGSMPYIGSSRNKYSPYLTMHFKRTEKFTPGDPVPPWDPITGGVYPPVLDPNWIYGLWRMEATSSAGSGYVLNSESTSWGQFTPQACQVISTHTHPTGLFGNAIQTISIISGTSGQGDRRLYLDTGIGGTFPYTGKTLTPMMKTSDPTNVTVEFFFKISQIDNSITKRVLIMGVGDQVWYNANLGRMAINGYVYGGEVNTGKLMVSFKNNVDYGYDGEGGNYIAESVALYPIVFGKNIADNAWHHFAFVKYGVGKIRFFLDGKKIFDETSIISDENYTQQANPNLYICCPQPEPGLSAASHFISQVDTLRVVTYAIYKGAFPNPVTYGSDLTV